MQPESNIQQNTVSRDTIYDAGLRNHFQSVYNIMAIGLVITGLTAYAVSNIPALMQLIFGTPLKYVAIFAPLLFTIFGFNPNAVMRRTGGQLKGLFYGFSAVFGVCMATIFLAYAGADIARVFFITAAMFAGSSIFGYTTKRDLSSMASLMIMGAIGIFIAMLVNIVLQSEMVYFVVSVVGVIVYTGLTAWDTQNIKETYRASYGTAINDKMAVMGALNLYINFIMLFQFLLQLFGGRR